MFVKFIALCSSNSIFLCPKLPCVRQTQYSTQSGLTIQLFFSLVIPFSLNYLHQSSSVFAVGLSLPTLFETFRSLRACTLHFIQLSQAFVCIPRSCWTHQYHSYSISFLRTSAKPHPARLPLVFFHAIFLIFYYFIQGPPGELGLQGRRGQVGEQVKCL